MKNIKLFCILTLCLIINYMVRPAAGNPNDVNNAEIDLQSFFESVDNDNDSIALSAGETILEKIKQKYPSNPAFDLYMFKLNAAETLADTINNQLEKSKKALMAKLAADLFDENASASQNQSTVEMSAKAFYEKYQKPFSTFIDTNGFTDTEKRFLSTYYSLRLKAYFTAIAKSAQIISTTEPSLNSVYDYILILLLLHTGEGQPINTELLPLQMRQPKFLNALSHSCLLYYGRVEPAMFLAKEVNQIQGKAVSESDIYRALADQCDTDNVDIAVKCLQKTIEYLPENDLAARNKLQFEIMQMWLDAGRYEPAITEAEKIVKQHGSVEDGEKAQLEIIEIYANNLKYYDIAARQCQQFLDTFAESKQRSYVEFLAGKLAYLNKDYATSSNKLDIFLIKYPDSPQIGPAMLLSGLSQMSQGNTQDAIELFSAIIQKYPQTDMAARCKFLVGYARLSEQQYAHALKIFRELVEQFPESEYAKQAQQLIDRLSKAS